MGPQIANAQPAGVKNLIGGGTGVFLFLPPPPLLLFLTLLPSRRPVERFAAMFAHHVAAVRTCSFLVVYSSRQFFPCLEARTKKTSLGRFSKHEKTKTFVRKFLVFFSFPKALYIHGRKPSRAAPLLFFSCMCPVGRKTRWGKHAQSTTHFKRRDGN